jgi:hypothetical protein
MRVVELLAHHHGRTHRLAVSAVSAVIILVVIVKKTINAAAPHHHPLEEGESPAPDQNRAQRPMTTAELPVRTGPNGLAEVDRPTEYWPCGGGGSWKVCIQVSVSKPGAVPPRMWWSYRSSARCPLHPAVITARQSTI